MAVPAADLNLIGHAAIDLPISHDFPGGMTVDTVHPFFKMDIRGQVQDKAIIAESLGIQVAFLIRGPVLVGFHLSGIGKPYSATSVMTTQTLAGGYGGGQAMAMPIPRPGF